MGPNNPLHTVFVLRTGNTLPATGAKTWDLSTSTGQFGIFDDAEESCDASGELSGSAYLLFAQGRLEDVNNDGNKLGTKKSSKIFPSKVIKCQKIVGNSTDTDEIWKLSNFDAIKPEEQVSLSVRVRSNYIDNAFAQSIGLLKSLTYNTPCADCGADPCSELSEDQVEAMVDFFIEKGNTHFHLNKYMTFSKELVVTVASGTDFQVGESVTTAAGAAGTVVEKATNVLTIKTTSSSATFTGNLIPATGSASAISSVNKSTGLKLVIEAKAPYAYGSDSVWTFTNQSVLFDKINIIPYFYKGAPTSQDNVLDERCENIVTITQTQMASYPVGTPAQVKQLFKRTYSYQSDIKTLYDDPDWNGGYANYVDASLYDMFEIEFEATTPNQWAFPGTTMTQFVTLAVPVAQTSTIEGIINDILTVETV